MIITSEPASTEIHKSYLKEEESTKQKNTALTKNKKRVLMVDDDASMRAILYDALSILGYEVVAAGNGPEGFEQFIQNSFDLVITDCKMPGMDGWQLSALVKKVSTRTPVIMVIGQDKYAVTEKMQESDIDYIMFKPFKLDDFYTTVRASLETD